MNGVGAHEVFIETPDHGRTISTMTRKNIEEYTKTAISIYGKTAAIIGTYENAEFARESLEKLIKGFTHKSVYKFLEEQQKRNKLKELAEDERSEI